MSSTSLVLPPSAGASVLGRLSRRVRANPAAIAAAATLALASGGLLLTHKTTPLAIPKAAALHHVLTDPTTARLLASLHWDRSDVTAMDSHYELLGFYRGPRMVATITIGLSRGLTTLDVTNLTREKYAYGSNIANDLSVLVMLAIVFILMTAVWPLWRIRNLDVLVAAGFALTVILFNRWMLTRMVIVSYPALAYLAIRCAWWGLGRPHEPSAAVPLFDRVARGWDPRQRVRMLRLVAIATALIVAMVGFTSLHVLDVGYAVMEGATAILHGVLPYGHIPDVLHGDTYPIGSYLFYVPFAWLTPVYNAWDNADLTLAIAVVAAIAAAIGISRIVSGWSHARGSGAADAGDTHGLRSAIALMTFPPVLVTVSTGTTDVVLAAMLVGALALWRRPAAASGMLSAAAWFKLAPVALLPLLLVRLRGRALASALLIVSASSLLLVGALVALGGWGAPAHMLSAMSFQFTRASPHTLWALIGNVPLQQLAEAATLALVVGAAVRIAREPDLAGDGARIAAIAAAVLIGVQFAANYWNYMYLVWIVPFLLVSILDSGTGAADMPDGAATAGV